LFQVDEILSLEDDENNTRREKPRMAKRRIEDETSPAATQEDNPDSNHPVNVNLSQFQRSHLPDSTYQNISSHDDFELGASSFSSPESRHRLNQRYPHLPPIQRRRPSSAGVAALAQVVESAVTVEEILNSTKDSPTPQHHKTPGKNSTTKRSKNGNNKRQSVASNYSLFGDRLAFPPTSWLDAPDDYESRLTSKRTHRHHSRSSHNKNKEFAEWFDFVYKKFVPENPTDLGLNATEPPTPTSLDDRSPEFSLKQIVQKLREDLEKSAETVTDYCYFVFYGGTGHRLSTSSSDVDRSCEGGNGEGGCNGASHQQQIQQGPKDIYETFKDDLAGSMTTRKKWLLDPRRSTLRRLAVKAHR
jgi:hypothetical protein